MKAFTVGAPIVSASLVTTKDTGEVVTKTVAKGDTLSGVVLAAPPVRCHPGCPIPAEDITIDSCTVVGFTIRSLRVPRGATTVYDGVPSYLRDPDGACFHGTLEETAEIKDIIVEIPAEEEGAAPVHRTIDIALIKDIGGGAAGTTEDEGGAEGGEDAGEETPEDPTEA